MLTGITSSGFAWQIEESALDDMELRDALVAWDNGDGTAFSAVCLHLLGKKQRAAFYDHLRGPDGRVKATQAVDEVNEILLALRHVKKS